MSSNTGIRQPYPTGETVDWEQYIDDEIADETQEKINDLAEDKAAANENVIREIGDIIDQLEMDNPEVVMDSVRTHLTGYDDSGSKPESVAAMGVFRFCEENDLYYSKTMVAEAADVSPTTIENQHWSRGNELKYNQDAY